MPPNNTSSSTVSQKPKDTSSAPVKESTQKEEIDDFSPLDCGPETALYWQ